MITRKYMNGRIIRSVVVLGEHFRLRLIFDNLFLTNSCESYRIILIG